MHKYLHVSNYCRIFASEKETNNKLNPKTRKGTEIMKTTANNTESKKMTLDEEMAMWEARANDEFGTILKVINEACADYFYAEPDEYGILTTPLSHYITAYALDGNREYTAKAIYSILENYDILEDGAIIALANKMKRLAA